MTENVPFEMKRKPCDAEGCTGWAYGRRYCGAYVCERCGKHHKLVRCFCGWSMTRPGKGRTELEEMGEQIDDDY